MLRTRDYALMLSAMVFLLVGIITTAATQGGFGVFSGQEAAVFVATPEVESYDAVIEENVELSREERVAALRKKIAALGTLGASAVEEVMAEQSSVPDAPEAAAGPVAENRCSNYSGVVVAWNSAGVRLEEVEGARLVYREAKVVTASSSSSSTAPTRQILAQLPVRSIPSASQSCVGNIVIGISKNGSLIRNTDVAGYGSFGGDTLVGYALDGFPIYGAADKKTDICGGLMEDGQYRYQISNSRDTIITCYAGSPISL
jgi:hypothetical protein